MKFAAWSAADALTIGLCLAPLDRDGRDVHGSAPVAEPGSHPGGVGPRRERVQVKHGLPPTVNGQRDAKDADDVHD